jgi:hypothetical protein
MLSGTKHERVVEGFKDIVRSFRMLFLRDDDRSGSYDQGFLSVH